MVRATQHYAARKGVTEIAREKKTSRGAILRILGNDSLQIAGIWRNHRAYVDRRELKLPRRVLH